MDSRRDFLKALLGMVAGTIIAPIARKKIPSRQKIVLLETHVAGFQYHEGMRRGVAKTLKSGVPLKLVREPQNLYDENAIAVHTLQGQHLGYIPRSLNEIPARIADQGIPLEAKVVKFHPRNEPWERLLIRVYQVIPEEEIL
ncbi:HIRAN domain-containing protein [Anaerolinea thermophila]|nr:HIRAN domain-containing protein [Anaerolinea thermophila]